MKLTAIRAALIQARRLLLRAASLCGMLARWLGPKRKKRHDSGD